MTKTQTFGNYLALLAAILASVLPPPIAHAETTHLVTTEGGFKTTHGLTYTITSDQMVFVQYYATTDDFNDEIVITLLARVDACTTDLEPSEKLAPLRESVVITRAD